MADLGGTFDSTTVEASTGYEPIPAGQYKCVATSSEWRATKNGEGRYIEFTWEIVEGNYTGRLIWSRLNLENANQQAVEIARKELSSICKAVGVATPRDTSELHNIPCMVKIAVKIRNDTGEPTNEVKGYSPCNASAVEPSSNKPAWL